MAKTKIIVPIAAAVAVALGVTGFAASQGAFWPKPKPKKAKSIFKKLPPPDEEDDLPLEAWEEEAEALGPVAMGWSDAPVGPHERAISRGHPEGFRLPDVTENPRVANAEEKPWKVLDPLEHPEFAPENVGVTFGPWPPSSTWPIKSKHYARLVTSYRGRDGWHGYSGRAFGSSRESDDGEERIHVGIDLFGHEKDVVVAPEDARVLTILPFHHGTWAVYLLTQDGRILNLGEVAPYSWRSFKIRPGSEVTQGQPLARIGRQTLGSTMVHFEMYDGMGATDEELIEMIRQGKFRWFEGEPVPERLYDPTAYLLTAAARTYRKEHGLSPKAS